MLSEKHLCLSTILQPFPEKHLSPPPFLPPSFLEGCVENHSPCFFLLVLTPDASPSLQANQVQMGCAPVITFSKEDLPPIKGSCGKQVHLRQVSLKPMQVLDGCCTQGKKNDSWWLNKTVGYFTKSEVLKIQ